MDTMEKNSSSAGMQPIGQTLKQAWEIFKSKGKQFLIVSLIFTVPLLFTAFLPDEKDAKDNMSMLNAGEWVAIILMAIIFMVLLLVCEVILAKIALRRSENMSLGELFRTSLKQVPSVLWIGILTALFVMLGFLAFLVPGIILTVSTSMGLYIYLDQGVKGWAAINKSRAYVKGKWWKVFLRMVVLVLLTAIPLMLITAFTQKSQPLTDILSSLLNLVLTPYAIIYMVLIYEQLRDATQAQTAATVPDSTPVVPPTAPVV